MLVLGCFVKMPQIKCCRKDLHSIYNLYLNITYICLRIHIHIYLEICLSLIIYYFVKLIIIEMRWNHQRFISKSFYIQTYILSYIYKYVKSIYVHIYAVVWSIVDRYKDRSPLFESSYSNLRFCINLEIRDDKWTDRQTPQWPIVDCLYLFTYFSAGWLAS